MEEIVKESIKVDFRRQALDVAHKLNPTVQAYNSALNTGNKVNPTAAQVIKDAETIYQWLIKEL